MKKSKPDDEAPRPEDNPRDAAERVKREGLKDAAALREEPEDRRASARQTTAPGKARSK